MFCCLFDFLRHAPISGLGQDVSDCPVFVKAALLHAGPEECFPWSVSTQLEARFPKVSLLFRWQVKIHGSCSTPDWWINWFRTARQYLNPQCVMSCSSAGITEGQMYENQTPWMTSFWLFLVRCDFQMLDQSCPNMDFVTKASIRLCNKRGMTKGWACLVILKASVDL